MDVYALDEKFKLVAYAIPYDNLQWSRRYYEAGDFAMQVPANVYDESWAYVGTSERPELGMVQRREVGDSSDDSVLISGFFCEKMLDDNVCYPRYVGVSPTTELAVRVIFTRYKEGLPIWHAPINEPQLGDKTRSDFSDDQLGEKIYSILESREMSYRVTYDYVSDQLYFSVWQGVDRTQSQSENAYQVFSTEFGNVKGFSFEFDDSDYKNYAIIPVNGTDEDNTEQDTLYLDLRRSGEKKRSVVIDMRAMRPEEGQNYSDFCDSVLQEAREEMAMRSRVENIDIDVIGSGYLTDYDLGDKCDVVISDFGIEMESRIIEVNEVFKADGHSITVGLGNKRISNIRRTVRR